MQSLLRGSDNSLGGDSDQILATVSMVSVLPVIRVCGTYIVHHLNSAELLCAALTSIVHHRSVLCPMVHKGDLCSVRGPLW